MWICTVNGKLFYFVSNQTYKIGRGKDTDLSFTENKYLSRVHIEFSFITSNNNEEENNVASSDFNINILPQTVQFTVLGQTGCEVDAYEVASNKNPLLSLSSVEENESDDTTIEDETEDLTKSKKYRRLESDSGFDQTKTFPKSEATRVTLPENKVWRFRLRIGSTIGKNNIQSTDHITFDFRWVPSILLVLHPSMNQLSHSNEKNQEEDEPGDDENDEEKKRKYQEEIEKFNEFKRYSSIGGFSLVTYSSNNNNDNNANQNLIRSLKLTALSALVSDDACPSDSVIFSALCAKKPIICRQIIINYVKRHIEKNSGNASDSIFYCRVAPPRFDALEALFPEKEILLSQSDNKEKEAHEFNFDREWTHFVTSTSSSSDSLKEMIKINGYTNITSTHNASLSSSLSLQQQHPSLTMITNSFIHHQRQENNNNDHNNGRNNNHVFNKNRCIDFQQKLLPNLESNQQRFSVFENLYFVTLNEQTRQEVASFVDLCDFVASKDTSKKVQQDSAASPKKLALSASSNRVFVDNSLYSKTVNNNNNSSNSNNSAFKITSTASSVKAFLEKHSNEKEATNTAKNHILVVSSHDEEFFASSALSEMRKMILTKMTMVHVNDILRSIFESHRLFFSFSEFVVSECYQKILKQNQQQMQQKNNNNTQQEQHQQQNEDVKTRKNVDAAVPSNNNNNFFQIGASLLSVDEDMRSRLMNQGNNNISNNTNTFNAKYGEDAAQQNTKNLFDSGDDDNQGESKNNNNKQQTVKTNAAANIKTEKTSLSKQKPNDQDEKGMILPAPMKREQENGDDDHENDSRFFSTSHREEFIRSVNNIPKVRYDDNLELSSQKRAHIIPTNIPCYMNFETQRNQQRGKENNNNQTKRSSSQKVFRKQSFSFDGALNNHDDAAEVGEFKVKLEGRRGNNNNQNPPSLMISNADNFFSVSTLQLPQRRQRKDDALFETSTFVASTKNQRFPIVMTNNKNDEERLQEKNEQQQQQPQNSTKRMQPLTHEEIQRAQGFLQHYANASSAAHRRIDADDIIPEDTEFGDFNDNVMLGEINQKRRQQLEALDYCYDHPGTDMKAALNQLRGNLMNNNNKNNSSSKNQKSSRNNNNNNNNNSNMMGGRNNNNNADDDDDVDNVDDEMLLMDSSSKKKKPTPKKAAAASTRGRKKGVENDDDDDVIIQLRPGSNTNNNIIASPPAKKTRGKKAATNSGDAGIPTSRAQHQQQQGNNNNVAAPRGIFDIDNIFDDM